MVFMLICMCFYFTGAPPPAEANFQACTGFIFFPELSLGLGHLRGHALCGAPLPILLPPPPLLPGLGQGLIVQVLLDPGPHTIRRVSHTWLASAKVSLLPSVTSASSVSAQFPVHLAR